MIKINLSRRLLLQRAAAAVGPVIALAAVPTSVAAQVRVKSSPQAASYQDQPHGAQRCDNCLHFQPPAACKVVGGRISPQGWCRIYVVKSR